MTFNVRVVFRLFDESPVSALDTMAMEKQHTISDVHTRPVTAIGFQVARREVFIGCEGKGLSKLTLMNSTMITKTVPATAC